MHSATQSTQHRSLVAIALLLLVMLAACGSAGQQSPTPAQKGLVIESIAYSLRQPYDGQIFLTVKGTLPDGCTQIAPSEQSWEEHDLVRITLTTTRSEGQACPQVETPFKELITIEDKYFGAGTYNVILNGIDYSFTLTEDDVWRKEGDDPGS